MSMTVEVMVFISAAETPQLFEKCDSRGDGWVDLTHR